VCCFLIGPSNLPALLLIGWNGDGSPRSTSRFACWSREHSLRSKGSLGDFFTHPLPGRARNALRCVLRLCVINTGSTLQQLVLGKPHVSLLTEDALLVRVWLTTTELMSNNVQVHWSLTQRSQHAILGQHGSSLEPEALIPSLLLWCQPGPRWTS
jgi:hypothetical protein